jgi:predicted phosphodiesterase
MKRVAALFDVHGNLPALKAVLGELDAEPVDAIVCGGDVLFGPYQSECLTLLRERGARFLAGNCEREVLDGGDDQRDWMAKQLAEPERRLVATWPQRVELDVDGLGRVLFCHASPRSDEEILTYRTPAAVLAEALAGADADVVVVGHTHQQFDLSSGRVRLVNAGSVGLPYEGRAGAFWLLLGPDVDLRGTEYDVAAGADSLRASGMPGIDDMLPDSLLQPAAREEVAAYFERRAGRGDPIG